jgi:hypothetical protein
MSVDAKTLSMSMIASTNEKGLARAGWLNSYLRCLALCRRNLVHERGVITIRLKDLAQQRGCMWRYLRVGPHDFTQSSVLRRLGDNTL